jgi:hypothetical protein
MVSALRATIITVDRANVLGVKARRAATVDDAGSTARFSNNALTTPMRASSVVYVLGVAHFATFSTVVFVQDSLLRA